MGYTMEGTIEIDEQDFWEFVMKYAPPGDGYAEIRFGVPRFNQDNSHVEIDFAASTDGDPFTWAVPPKVKKQWDEYNNA